MAEQPNQVSSQDTDPKINPTGNIKGSIYNDPFIRSFLEKVPKDIASSFTESQLLQLKLMFGTRAKAQHIVDIRTVMGSFSWSYYFVFLLGRNRRDLTRAEQRMAYAGKVFFLLLGSLVLFSVAIISLYLVKSFLGIDLLPHFSFGLWTWLSE
ncbi:hypothetical protein [Enterovibrio nigricans]|uniref:3-phosphoshikimate 1-carboxyvinyltransferase n=1 Tax=Enterovibrio nigricans DSM 22720 TaxID=1121868 RepID=A0A1T4U752_9GAMM|nr:hypothetical protein [Enterovibrio nigricans]PKF51725.1 hypothetical protein AT251_01515 [Enterovibrio nigricans]SKA48430.1 hypothetical protein SAMN02745132_00895 [Enterovibrio nigricans DSM 22720]